MGELGTILRETRESLGLSIEQAEQETRIRRVFLEALEEERFDQLPGDVYVRGFIRNYGRYLGLDPQELLPLYRAFISEGVRRMPQVLNEPLLPASVGNVWSTVFLVAMILIVVGLAGWYGYQRLYRESDPFVGVARWVESLLPMRAPASKTEAPTRPATMAASTSVANVAATRAMVQPTATAKPTMQARVPTAVATQRVVIPPTQRATRRIDPTRTPIPSPVPTRDPEAPPSEIEGIEIRVEALEKCYVFVLSDGEVVYEEILDTGQKELWVAQEKITVRIGNAAGIRVYVNNVEVPPLGEPGQVVELEYTPDTLPPG